MKKILFQNEKIDISLLLNDFGTDSDGAIVNFIGRVRNNSKGKSVKFIEYEIYDSMARKEIDKILDEAIEKFSINSCLVVQRYGHVDINEASILISVSSPHREESYHASKYIIDSIKEKVPIWKKEFYLDGSSWITDTH